MADKTPEPQTQHVTTQRVELMTDTLQWVVDSLRKSVPGGLNPDWTYDTNDIAAILNLGENRRKELQRRLRREFKGGVIENGHSIICRGEQALQILGRMSQ